MTKRAIITPEIESKVKQLVGDGIDRNEVAKMVGVSRGTVYRIMPANNKKELSAYSSKIIKLYNDGLSQIEIHEKLGISKSMVHRALRNIPKRKSIRRKKVQIKAAKTSKADNHKQIKRLWQEEGLTKSRIAKKLNLSYSTVDKAILAMGIEEDRKIEKLQAIDRITGTIKVRLDHKTEVYFPQCDNLEDRILKKKIQLGIIKK